jgi:hypothetical protein
LRLATPSLAREDDSFIWPGSVNMSWLSLQERSEKERCPMKRIGVVYVRLELDDTFQPAKYR